MWKPALSIALGVALAGAALAHVVFAQNAPASGPSQRHDQGSMPLHGAGRHTENMPVTPAVAGGAPTLPGQDAFGALAEVVRILDADPNTDWRKVDLERLRQHLIDMNEVVLRSAVKSTPVAGGLAMEITGTGRTEQAIRAMVVPHAVELGRMAEWSARTEPIVGGVRLIVVAKRSDDTRVVARIRGLGFAGLITEGAHHQPHHLAMAKGEALAGHGH